jgi:hypothetical protein
LLLTPPAMRLVLQVAHGMVVELHFELRRWLVFAPLPAKIAARIRNTTLMSCAALTCADANQRRAYHVDQTSRKLRACLRLLDQLRDQQLLGEPLHQCFQRKIHQILEELTRYDPQKRVLIVRRDEPFRLMN